MIFSENELITEIKKRNQDAYEELIQQYTKPIFYLVYKILNTSSNKEDFEECVSDVLLDVWLKINDFDAEKGSFKTWVFMLTKYKALKYKAKKEGTAVFSIETYEIEEPVSLEKTVIDRHKQEKIIQTIHAFNKVDKELFIRRYFYGEKISDLIDKLGLSRSAIDNRLLRGRNKIREVLLNE